MTTTTGDPRIDNNEAIQSWIDWSRPMFSEPDEALLAGVQFLRDNLREAGITRWTPDLRAVLWAALLSACKVTAVREWNTCYTVRQDQAHWVSHYNDKWAFYAAVLVLIDAEGTI